MREWHLIGIGFGERVGGDRAIYHRELADGTVLVARVRNADGRPQVDEIAARFSNQARDFGREIAITELERAINANDTWWFPDARTGQRVSPFALGEIPVGVSARGSRGRKTQWPDERLAELVRDIEIDNTAHWFLERNTIRQRANEAVRRGIAEVLSEGPPKSWRLTDFGVGLLGS